MYVEVSKDYPLTYQINYYLMKQCTKCNEVKELTEFYKRNASTYRLDCKDCVKARVAKNYDPKKKSQYDKSYRKSNAVEIASYKKRWEHHRYHTNTTFRLSQLLRSRLHKALNGVSKSAATTELLGCTPEHARLHIENQFTEGMTWDNIHVDHIQPCASFDLEDPNEQRKCFHYTNLQPLFASDNLRKSDQIVPEHQVRLL